MPPGLARLAWRAGGVWMLAREALLPRRIGSAMLFAAAAAVAAWAAWPGSSASFATPGVRGYVIAMVLLLAGLPLLARPLSLQGFNYVSGLGNANIGVQQLFANTTFHYADNFTVIRGRHMMKMGAQLLREWINVFYAGNNGRSGFIDFNGRFTAQNAVNPSGTQIGEADFMLGLPDQLGRGLQSGTWGQRSNISGLYFQDDWRVTNNLTAQSRSALGIPYALGRSGEPPIEFRTSSAGRCTSPDRAARTTTAARCITATRKTFSRASASPTIPKS